MRSLGFLEQCGQLLAGLGVLFEAVVVVVAVLEVEPLQLFGMTCAVWVDSTNFMEKELLTSFLGVSRACLSMSKE